MKSGGDRFAEAIGMECPRIGVVLPQMNPDPTRTQDILPRYGQSARTDSQAEGIAVPARISWKAVSSRSSQAPSSRAW